MGIYEECKICKEKIATPTHVMAAHGMKNYTEYKELIKDKKFMKDVEQHRKEREEREEKEYHMSRLLIYHWFPRAASLTRLMSNFGDHAKTTAEVFNSEVDLSAFADKDEAVVGTVVVAEALTKNGWKCVTVKGVNGPKEYHMKRI